MSLEHESDIQAILTRVSPWPEEERVALAYMILRNMRKQTREPAPRNTVDQAAGIAQGNSPPPDDETVQRWIEEHRLRKYG